MILNFDLLKTFKYDFASFFALTNHEVDFDDITGLRVQVLGYFY